jgi:hypothetical protein
MKGGVNTSNGTKGEEKSIFSELEIKVIDRIIDYLEWLHPQPRNEWKYKFDYYKTANDESYLFTFWSSLRPLITFDVEGKTFAEVVGKMYIKLADLP